MNKDQGPLIEGESEARILGAEEDRIKRPGFFKNLIPFLITVPILYLVLHDQDWEEIKQAVPDCNLWLL